MPLQNRVTPTGEVIADPARGTLFGNRGLLHNDRREIVRSHRGIRWITCVLEFKGRRRSLMVPGRYTELFFLDEPTALAAGHRPCAECRRADFNRFRRAWAAGHGWARPPTAAELDESLHADRWDEETGAMRRWEARVADLPDGAFVLHQDDPQLVRGRGLHRWAPSGYTGATGPPSTPVTVLTPRSIVAALTAGY